MNAFGGGFDAAHLAATEVERIEVVRGPQSALYGDGAIGGIVHVVTPHGGPTRGNALFEGGGYGTTHLAAGGAGSHKAWSWGANLDWLSTDGDTRERANLGRRVANDDYETISGSANVSWSDRADRRLRVDLLLGHNERGNPGPYGSDPEHLYGGLDLVARGTNDTTGLRAAWTVGSAKRFRHSVQFTATDVNSKFNSASFSVPGAVDTNNTDTNRVTGRYQFDLERRRVGLSAGWELLFEQEKNDFIKDTNDAINPVERNVSGLFVETRWPFGARAFLNAGIRFEHIARSALAAGLFGQPALAEDTVWSTNPKISGAWFVRPPDARGWTKLRFGAGTGIKPPTAFDLAFTNNPGLKPERSRSFDVGVEQALVGSALVADLTWFANRYDDLIVTVGSSYSGASQYQTDNIANASAKGLELGASFRSVKGLSARVAYTFLDTEVLSVDNVPSPIAPSPYHVGDPLIRRPRNQASADVTWTAGRAQAFFVVNGRGKVSDIEPTFASSLYPNPGYAVVAIGGAFRITRGLDAYARVTNLFDKSYEEALGFPALGRTAMIGVRIAATR
jgi:outer membrane receptor protein involved in Fe transport